MNWRAGLGSDPAFDCLVDGFPDHVHAGQHEGLRKRWFQDRHLFHGDAIGVHHWGENLAGDGLAAQIVLLGPLHEGADDVLFCSDAAIEVELGLQVSLIVDDGRMARVGHKIGDVGAGGEFSAVGRRRIQADHQRSGPQVGHDAVGHLTEDHIGHGQDYHVSLLRRVHGVDGCCVPRRRRA